MRTKVCFKCKLPQPVASFYAHPQTSDGLSGKCKECTKKAVIENRLKNVAHYRRYDITRNQSAERKRMWIDKQRRKRKAMGPDYTKAHNAVANAVASGVMSRPKRCQRCKKTRAVNGHHDDYARPLDVMWLCVICHAARHRELGRLTGTKKF